MEGLFLLGFFVGSYFLPTMVALARDHRNAVAIFVLNLLLGWTLIGWVAAIVWACAADRRVGAAT